MPDRRAGLTGDDRGIGDAGEPAKRVGNNGRLVGRLCRRRNMLPVAPPAAISDMRTRWSHAIR